MAQGWPFAILHGASGPPPGTIRTPALKLIPVLHTDFGT